MIPLVLRSILIVALSLHLGVPMVGQDADAIYRGNSILTMAGESPTYVESIAVKDGRIIYAGDREGVMKFRDNDTRVVDLGEKALLPGFLDAHSHYINSLLVVNQCKLYAPPSGPGKNVPSIIAALKKYAVERKIPKGELMMGYGYDDTVMPDGRLLNRDDLDDAFPDNPVRIDHVSMHGEVMNSSAANRGKDQAMYISPMRDAMDAGLPLKVAPMNIKDIKVVETIKAGATIFPATASSSNLPTASSKYAGMSYQWRAHVFDMAEVNQLTGTYALIDNQSITLGELVSTKVAGAPERMEL